MGSINRIVEEVDYLHSHPDLWGPFVGHAWHVVKATGDFPDTPIWNYIEWKRGLHPHWFDLNHPCLAKLFRYEESHESHAISSPVEACPVLPPFLPCHDLPGLWCPPQPPSTTCPPPTPPGQPTTSGTTPEPSSIILLGIAIVVAMLRRIL